MRNVPRHLYLVCGARFYGNLECVVGIQDSIQAMQLVRHGRSKDGLVGIIVDRAWEVGIFGGVLDLNIAETFGDDIEPCLLSLFAPKV